MLWLERRTGIMYYLQCFVLFILSIIGLSRIRSRSIPWLLSWHCPHRLPATLWLGHLSHGVPGFPYCVAKSFHITAMEDERLLRIASAFREYTAFFSGFGRWSSKARSCKLHKLSNKRLNTNGSGCTVIRSGNENNNQTTQKTPRTTRKSPSQISVSPCNQKRSNSRTGPEPNQNKKEQLPHGREGRDPSMPYQRHAQKLKTN